MPLGGVSLYRPPARLCRSGAHGIAPVDLWSCRSLTPCGLCVRAWHDERQGSLERASPFVEGWGLRAALSSLACAPCASPCPGWARLLTVLQAQPSCTLPSLPSRCPGNVPSGGHVSAAVRAPPHLWKLCLISENSALWWECCVPALGCSRHSMCLLGLPLWGHGGHL